MAANIGRTKVRIFKKGSLKGFEEDLKQAKAHPSMLFAKLGLKDKFVPAMIHEMVDSIKSGKTFRSLKKSTREIRAQRRARVNRKKTPPVHLSKPLYETGALLKSLEKNIGKKTRVWKGNIVDSGITFNKYGVWQANGFVVGLGGGKMSGRDIDEMVESLEETASEAGGVLPMIRGGFRYGTMEGKVVPPRDFITVAGKKALPQAVAHARIGMDKYWNKRLRPHIITRLGRGVSHI